MKAHACAHAGRKCPIPSAQQFISPLQVFTSRPSSHGLGTVYKNGLPRGRDGSWSPTHSAGTNHSVHFTWYSTSQKTNHLLGGLIVDPTYSLSKRLFTEEETIHFLTGKKDIGQPNETKASMYCHFGPQFYRFWRAIGFVAKRDLRGLLFQMRTRRNMLYIAAQFIHMYA